MILYTVYILEICYINMKYISITYFNISQPTRFSSMKMRKLFRIMERSYSKIRRAIDEVFYLYFWYVAVRCGTFWYIGMPRRIFCYEAIPTRGALASVAVVRMRV
jgi:hypothetical protein